MQNTRIRGERSTHCRSGKTVTSKPCGNRRRRVCRRRLVEIVNPFTVALAVSNETKLDLRTALQRRRRHIALGLRRDQDSGFAVVEDVGKLVRRQKRIDTCIVETRARTGAAALDVARVIFHEDGVMIEPPKTAGAKKMRQPITARFEFRVGHRLAGLRHDEGRLTRALSGMIAGIHGARPPIYSSSVAVTGTWSEGRLALR